MRNSASAKKPPKKPIKKPPQKPVKPAAKPKKTLEDKAVIPDSGIDFCGVKLTALRRAFIINYVTPGQPCFHNALQAALKAGYKESVAKTEIYSVIREPDIQKIIKTNENLIHQKVHESAMRALELKQRRAFFDPLDYFQEKEIAITKKDGEEYTKSIMALKPLEEMTPEQRMCIDGIDIKGQANVPVYLMADREKELNDIIKIDNELAKGLGSTDEEETREIIMERITIRETRRAQRPADIEYEIVERPGPDMKDNEEGEE
jgi:phage terminase small subunit